MEEKKSENENLYSNYRGLLNKKKSFPKSSKRIYLNQLKKFMNFYNKFFLGKATSFNKSTKVSFKILKRKSIYHSHGLCKY